MRLILLLTIAGILAAAAPAAGDPVQKQRAGPSPTEITDMKRERIICEKIARIGSRIPQRVCRTESQIEAERAAAGKWTARKQEEASRSGGLPPGVGGPG